MSATNSDDDLSSQNRRLRLRNSLVRPSRLSYGSSGVLSPPRKLSLSIDDNGWETEDAESTSTVEATTPNDSNENTSNSARKRRGRNSAVNALSTANTLLNLPDDTPLFGMPERAMTSPSPGGLKAPSAGAMHRRNRSGSEGVQGSSRYVDYLERQVADLLVQLQGYTSPASGASHAMKMRRLSSEARNLRNEVIDWEAKFNIRVKEEVEMKVAQDNTLRGKVRVLEDRLEETEERLREAEEEVGEYRVRVRDMKGLEEENRALEFRVETLSNLLAESTRMERGGCRSRGSTVGSSSRLDSVGMERCVTISTSTTTPRESRRGSVEVDAISPNSSPGRGVEDYGILDPIDHVLLSMTSLRDDHTALSIAPPTPISPLPDSTRSRRMRKFPSGSSAPKTLILPSAAVVPTATTSPTLPTIRTFFNTPIADPSSMCSFTRPSSAGSTATNTSAVQMIPVRPALATSNSLFAELARAENESVSDTDETPAPTSPTLSDTFTLVTDAINNPTPLLIKAVTMVGNGIRSPTGTFLTARRTAMDMLSGVVGKGVERVSRRRARLLQSKSKEARRRMERIVEDRVRRCDCMCAHSAEKGAGAGAGAGVPLALARGKSQPLGPDDAVENVWLWVRFVVALVVALGVAVKEGPAVVLAVDGVDYDAVDEEERESAIRALSEKGGRDVRVVRGVVGGETRAEKMRREWKGMGDERLRLWERERSGCVGVHVGDGRRKAMEWGM